MGLCRQRPWEKELLLIAFGVCHLQSLKGRKGAVSEWENSQWRINSACFRRGGLALESNFRNFCSWNGNDCSCHTMQIIVNLRPGQRWAKEGLIWSNFLLKIASSRLCSLPLLYSVLRVIAGFMQARQVAFPSLWMLIHGLSPSLWIEPWNWYSWVCGTHLQGVVSLSRTSLTVWGLWSSCGSGQGELETAVFIHQCCSCFQES